MSKILIEQYYQNLDRTLQFGKSRNEQSIRNHFWSLLNDYARKSNYEVIAEVAVIGTKGKNVYPDGTVKNLWGLNIGLWESKDEKDDLQAEIEAKTKKGYPLDNILFEDSNTAILWQYGSETMRAEVRNPEQLDKILTTFINFKSETVYNFELAIEKFKADIPNIVKTLREKIIESRERNPKFMDAQMVFWELCQAEINPDITLEDIREMMIQHILTSDIFNKIFDDPDFHSHNNIAAELEKLIGILFTHEERRNLLYGIEHYYQAINATAAGITDHHEKQKFLKVLYENFYKVYNPKAADRLGVVYTPNEIVQFMVQSTNYLLHQCFGKTFADEDVDILDPATGTGTFICEIIENAIPKQNLEYKFRNEIHANEVAILPYYIANLNIEYTYKQKMGSYAEFPNLCFVDTLDNIGGLSYKDMQHNIFGITSENSERISRQNSKKISVIIGNPPYNANQLNENENNKNREYPSVDKRIKDTYIKHSTAQKTKVYDMYARFYRWATDRLDRNGILAFITNRSFIDSRTFDGFRKIVASEFNAIYIIDLGGDVRANPKLSGTKNNVFGIQTGVAIMILIRHDKNFREAQTKKELNEMKEELNIVSEPVVLYKTKEYFSTQGCLIYYLRRPEMETAQEKLQFLKDSKLEYLVFDRITPDKNNNWINQSEDNDWEDLIPLAYKKPIKSKNTIFKSFSNGISTNRDEWVYDFDLNNLENKINHFIKQYNDCIKKNNTIIDKIKWSRDLKLKIKRKLILEKSEIKYIDINYRPYVKKLISLSPILIDVIGINHLFYLNKNNTICINSNGKDFRFLGVDTFTDLHYSGDTKNFPLYSFTISGNKIDNITDWGLEQFRVHYKDEKITKEDIFYYTYGVLHNPEYRKKYALNLKREFPRLPFYADFGQWVAYGKVLMELHIGYETIDPYGLKVVTDKDVIKPKAKLKADKAAGIIILDEATTIEGIPAVAWDYKLGNRSALEWILDQYKEKRPTDKTIAEKFNTYRFADYKDKVIELLQRVCTVSVKTMNVVRKMSNDEC